VSLSFRAVLFLGRDIKGVEMQLPWLSNGRLLDLSHWLCAHLGALPLFHC